MEVIRCTTDTISEEIIQRVVWVLSRGGVAMLPADTLYALCANALNEKDVRHVFRIKGRPEQKPVPVGVRDHRWAEELAYVNTRQSAFLKAVWPGPVSVILESRDIVPAVVTAGSGTVALCAAAAPVVDAVLHAFGYPLTLMSANISGQESFRDVERILESFSRLKPDIVVDVGALPFSAPSTIVDLTGAHPRIARVGAAKPEDLLRTFSLITDATHAHGNHS
ncbi:MAG: L-threonylcarbamoyladenylate synthase [Patescibacteria group bacterium]